MQSGIKLEKVNVWQWKGSRWESKSGDWPVKDPLEKIISKYKKGTSLIFDLYVFNHSSDYPHVVSETDINAADVLMGANISAKNKRWQNAIDSLEEINRILKKYNMPRHASIEDEENIEKAADVINRFRRDEIGLAIATKVLLTKQPYLIPMMDSVVQDCFTSDDPGHILKEFKRLLSDTETKATVADIIKEIKKIFNIDVSPLRIIEQLIWFDWNLVRNKNGTFSVRGFEEWIFNPNDEDSGVHRK